MSTYCSAKKLNINYEPLLDIIQIEKHIISSYASRKSVKIMAYSFGLEYKTQDLAKGEAGEITATTFFRNMSHLDNQRRIFRNIRHMEGNTKRDSTSKITLTNNDSSVKEFNTKESVEEVTEMENNSKSRQTEGGNQFLSKEFVAEFGTFREGRRVQDILDGHYNPQLVILKLP